MLQAGTETFGPRLSWDGIEASGGLDPQLVAEAARRSGLSFTEELHQAFRRRYRALLEKELARETTRVRVMPGVLAVVASLREHPEVALGVLTGNYRQTAALKLRAIGVDPGWFEVSVFGDEAASRPALVALALEKLEALEGTPVEPRKVIIVGDTPRDVDAALRNGCRALGVATGKYDVAALLEAGAHAAVETLEDPGPLWALLNGQAPHPSRQG